jgi:hypothetical protein
MFFFKVAAVSGVGGASGEGVLTSGPLVSDEGIANIYRSVFLKADHYLLRALMITWPLLSRKRCELLVSDCTHTQLVRPCLILWASSVRLHR